MTDFQQAQSFVAGAHTKLEQVHKALIADNKTQDARRVRAWIDTLIALEDDTHSFAGRRPLIVPPATEPDLSTPGILRAFMREHHMTYRDLSSALNVPYWTFKNWMSEKCCAPANLSDRLHQVVIARARGARR